MAGPKIYSGHRPNNGGPTADLLHVGAGQQRAYIPELLSGSTQIIWYAMQGRVGSTGGTKRGRFYVAYTGSGQGSGGSGSRVPTSPVSHAYTSEFTTTRIFSGSNEGETTPELNLDRPFASARNAGHAHGAISRDNGLVVGMTQVASLGGVHNSWFYDRASAANALPASGYTSTVNAGHMAIWKVGEANVAPTAPTSTAPTSGASETTLTPNIAGNFNDANKVLENGVAWDYASQARIQVRQGTTVIWDHTYTTTSTERNNHRTIRRYAGPALSYYTTYSYRIQHIDRLGAPGAWSGWIYFSIRHNNRAPNTPTNLSGLGTIHGTRSVTVGATFSDPDYPSLPNGQSWERFESKQIIVRRVSDNQIVYDSGVVSTTSTERSNARSSTSWTLPEWDVTYRWYERHFDRTGAASAYATGTVVARSGGAMGTPTPSGRITNLANPGVVSSMYTNTGAVNATRIQFRLRRGGVTVDTADFTGLNHTRNSLFSRTWSQAFGTLELSPGLTYTLEARAYSGVWSDWSPASTLVANARPSIPVLYGPSNGAPVSELPELAVRADDPDQGSDELTVTRELYDAALNLIDTSTLTHRPEIAGGNVHSGSLDGVITDLGVYRWRTRSSDGYLTSGWSPMWAFHYADVPAVTWEEPTGPVVSTMQPTLRWSASGQIMYQVRAYDLQNNLVYNTGIVQSQFSAHQVSTDDHWIGGERWNRDETFIWEVGITTNVGLWGWSSKLSLTLEYTSPDAVTVDIEPQALPGVEGTHYALLVTSEPNVPHDEFVRMVIDRVEIDGPGGNEIPGTLIENRFIARNPTSNEFADFDMTSRQWYRWIIRYESQIGVDIVESDTVYAEMMVSFWGTLLHMPFDPEGQYVWLQWGAPEYEPRRRKTRMSGAVHPVNSALPVSYSGRNQTIDIDGEYTLLDRGDMTASEQLSVLDRMFDYQDYDKSPDGRPHGMCWREGGGGRDARLYVELMEIESVPSYQGSRAVVLVFEARHYRIGEPE